MTNACPHCGKPLRPGARFCGSCGKTLQESKVTPPTQSEKTTCPHCGKPVRPDAKFCPSCGQSIPVAAAAVAAATPPEEGDSTQPEQQLPPSSEPPPPDADSSPAPPPKPFFSRYWWVILLVLLICVILIPGGIIYSLDPFDWRATETPTATATVPESPILTGTEEEIASTQTETPVDTPAPPTEEPTSEPSATPEPETETPTPEATETQETTVTATQEVILDEDFEGDLQENWAVWGAPIPKTIGAPGQRALDLDADPRAAGITSKEIITVAPRLEIKFNAALKEISADNILTFDWDPGTESRNPDERDIPGLIHIQIDENGAKLVIISDGQECTQELNVDENHEYAIIFEQNRNVTFRIDNEQICMLQIQIRPDTDGRISFSGRGWIVSVIVGEIR